MTGGDLIRILNRKPEAPWPDAALHHGVRAGILLVLTVSTSALFPVSLLPDMAPVERGAILEEDVIAEVPFPVYKSAAELREEQRTAVERVNPIFVYDTTAVSGTLAALDRFFGEVDNAAGAATEEAGVRAVRSLLERYGIRASDGNVELLLDPAQRRRLRSTLRTVVVEELPQGIAVTGELEETGGQVVDLQRNGGRRLVRPDSIRTTLDLGDRSRYYVPRDVPGAYEQLQRLILLRLVEPSVKADRPATALAREQARQGVDPVRTMIQQNQRVVPAREPITDADVERFRAYRQELERLGQVENGRVTLRAFGGLLFNLIVLTLFGALLFLYRQDVYRNLRHVLLIAFLVLSLVAVAALLGSAEQPIVALVPIAFPALVVATLWDGRLALNLSLIMAILLAAQTPFLVLGMEALVTLVAAGAVASLSVRVTRRRSQVWAYIGLITGAYVLTSVVLGTMRLWSLQEIGIASGWGAVSAVASAFAAMGFMPLFEGFTKITTDQTLLELADANRPLLRRLSMEAPGTYAHSINVANLAEAAAGGIGANALLTRVGVYYHDVGKIGRPHYFIENQPGGRNPHDKLKPATSAQVVRNHVLDGLRLADEEKLPDCVKAFIVEHHGT
ncbi:MAG: HDIG domain-containing protein, partial [Gemmatimonadetes bacterium]|nr:HDIG domain-containing protein [Gemmatimonadota bacterium]NIQ58629.1 HDIG domain-containing protein [Gemmatimonadota bacterium]NIU78820.1 HDIG domain-containing protein [Gammaproteobacteria bacterium]NIX47627.1 HDIG domain-containing protein [Gemmatimonadota bacterium]NIY11989.1 HDIG domain-containing protein [Gemmatimonadota bacterium]